MLLGISGSKWVGLVLQASGLFGVFSTLGTLGGSLAELSHCKIACIGPSTAEAWVALGGLPLVPKVFHAEALEAMLRTGITAGHCCWLPRH